MVVAAAAMFTAAAILVWPSLTGSLSESVDPGSVAVRAQRLPLLFQLVQDHKVSGLGFGGLRALGLPTTDFGWLRIYGSVGTLGLACCSFSTAGARSHRARRLPAARQARVACAAAMSALMLADAAGFVYDTFTIMTTGRVIWLVAGMGLVAPRGSR